MDDRYGYNLESGGCLNKHMSEESRRKMSESKKGKYEGENNPMFGVHLTHTEEWKRKASERFSGENNPMFGVHNEVSDATRKLLSEKFSGENNPFYGKKHTEESRKRMSDSKPKKSVVCVETGVRYESVNDAQRKTGVHGGSISRACKNPNKTAGTYHWEYVV